MNGGSGNDYLREGGGADTLNGGDGIDVCISVSRNHTSCELD